jgi:hypothetical protein
MALSGRHGRKSADEAGGAQLLVLQNTRPNHIFTRFRPPQGASGSGKLIQPLNHASTTVDTSPHPFCLMA